LPTSSSTTGNGEAVKNSPEYHAEREVDRAYGAALHKHHDLPIYWGV
jgi:hypothetical protein